MAFNWICPHCATPQSVAKEKFFNSTERIWVLGQAEDTIGYQIQAVGCANPDCERTTVEMLLKKAKWTNNGTKFIEDGDVYFHQRIYPHGAAKPQPNYIPQPLRADYSEACLIRDLSPKAASTLVRRCLQGMIRDFAGIAKPTLFAEIDALRKAVDDRTAPETITHDHIEAIDAVRGIGNIGAHMEKDINIIVEVDPGEAQALIELVEMLFEEWYIARHKRQQRLDQIQQMAKAKQIAIIAQQGLRAADDGEPQN